MKKKKNMKFLKDNKILYKLTKQLKAKLKLKKSKLRMPSSFETLAEVATNLNEDLEE
jgi:hypothetical protein